MGGQYGPLGLAQPTSIFRTHPCLNDFLLRHDFFSFFSFFSDFPGFLPPSIHYAQLTAGPAHGGGDFSRLTSEHRKSGLECPVSDFLDAPCHLVTSLRHRHFLDRYFWPPHPRLLLAPSRLARSHLGPCFHDLFSFLQA
jgi:hypothetical protein